MSAIRKNPVDKPDVVVGNLSCNSSTDRNPRVDLVANLKAVDPDLLFFAGDQSYDHKEHRAAWLLFGRQFGDVIKDRPTVTIPDDHDVGHPNLWGAGGKPSFRTDGAVMKCVLSQSPYSNAARLHGRKQERLVADPDSNG